MANKAKKPVAVFHFSRMTRISDFMQRCVGVAQNVEANSTIFVTPKPTPSEIFSKLEDLQKAEAKVLTRAAGAAAERDIVYTELVDLMWALLAYVQLLANEAADEQSAIAIIEASGFSVKINTPKIKAPIAAKNLTVSGQVKLDAKAAGKRASYNWQQAEDAPGATWADLVPTTTAKTVLTGLAQGSRVKFRVRTITKDGAGPWTQAVSLIVT